MPGNRTSPMAALFAPLVGYMQGEIQKREQDRAEAERLREAMRRASVEDEELALARERVGLERRQADRLDRTTAAEERERARGAGERAGALARRTLALQQLREAHAAGKKLHEIDPVVLAESGLDTGALKAIGPYDPANDPQAHLENLRHRNQIAEIDRRADRDLGNRATLARMGGGSGTPEEIRRLQVANANFAAALRAVAADMGDLDIMTQHRMWQDALVRAGLDPVKYGQQMPTDPGSPDVLGEFDPSGQLGGMLTDTLFMQSIGVSP